MASVTEPEADFADRPVLLTDETGNRVCLGPTLLTGDALETAGVDIDPTGQWTVNPVFRTGSEGIDAFNEAASLCFVSDPGSDRLSGREVGDRTRPRRGIEPHHQRPPRSAVIRS